MTTIKKNIGIDHSQRHKEVVLDQAKPNPSKMVRPQTNTFSHGATAQLARGNETAPRQGVQRTATTQAVQATHMHNSITNGQNIHIGSRGAAVTELQTILNNAGAQPPLELDGKFGPLTQQAVRDFQTQRGTLVCKLGQRTYYNQVPIATFGSPE